MRTRFREIQNFRGQPPAFHTKIFFFIHIPPYNERKRLEIQSPIRTSYVNWLQWTCSAFRFSRLCSYVESVLLPYLEHWPVDVLQTELDDVMDVWDSHNIRPSSNPLVPSSRPTIMYRCPTLWGTKTAQQRSLTMTFSCVLSMGWPKCEAAQPVMTTTICCVRPSWHWATITLQYLRTALLAYIILFNVLKQQLLLILYRLAAKI